MSDLDELFEDLFSGAENVSFPEFPGTTGASGNGQTIENADISRLSRISRTENEGRGILHPNDPGNSEFFSGAVARVETMCFDAGKSGKAGKSANSLAGSDTSHFPASSSLPGKIEDNREIQGLQVDPSPISPATVRAAVKRELRALAAFGRTGPDALRNAIEITAAKIRNSETLAERQANGSCCHVCERPLDDTSPVVAVLTGKRGWHLYMHDACHAEHRTRRTALVEKIMAAAGFGPTQSEAAA